MHAETLSDATTAPIRALHPFGYGRNTFTVTDPRVRVVILLGTEGFSRASDTGPKRGAGPGRPALHNFHF